MVPLSSVARNWLFYGYYSVCGQVNERTALVGLSMSFAFLRAFYKFALFLTAQRSGIDFINALIAHSLIRASPHARARSASPRSCTRVNVVVGTVLFSFDCVRVRFVCVIFRHIRSRPIIKYQIHLTGNRTMILCELANPFGIQPDRYKRQQQQQQQDNNKNAFTHRAFGNNNYPVTLAGVRTLARTFNAIRTMCLRV